MRTYISSSNNNKNANSSSVSSNSSSSLTSNDHPVRTILSTTSPNTLIHSSDQHITRRTSPQTTTFGLTSSSVSIPPVPFSSSFTDALQHEASQRNYSDFSTLDWVHHVNLDRGQNRHKPSHAWASLYDILQAWGSVTLLGLFIGCSVAWADVVFEFVHDLKLGFCSSAYYLNKRKCCWEQWDDEGTCPDWHEWSYQFILLRYFPPLNFFFYVFFSTLMASIASLLVISYAPEYGPQSGIAEVKTILGGFVMQKALSFRTGLIKWFSLVYSMASGLSIGNKAPQVHLAACIGNWFAQWFPKYRDSEAAKNHFLSCACAAGIAAAFGSPIGGILFALEEVASFFPIPVMWMAFMCCLWATLMLQVLNPFNTGSMVAFQAVHLHEWHLFELLPFAFLGVLGGLLGALFTRLSIRIQLARRRSEFCLRHPILDVTYLSFITSFFCYWSALSRDHILSLLAGLFKNCDPNENYHGICNSSAFSNCISLLYALVLRFVTALLTYGASIPSGIFLPCMAIGACLGRIVGIVLSAFQISASHWPIFSSCQIGDKDCVAPGSYALLGAAAALTGATRMTISIVVILFELTGALHFVLPTIMVVVVAKFVADLIGKEGYSTLMVQLNHYPFLETRQDYNFSMSVDQLMTSKQLVLLKNGLCVHEVHTILSSSNVNTFPIVNEFQIRGLEGCITRRELQSGLGNAQSETQLVYFHSPVPAIPSSSFPFLDLRPWTDQTPLTVHPRSNVSFVYQLFLKLGLRYVFVKHKGKLVGLITKKDMIRFTNASQGTFSKMDYARHHVFALDPMIDRHQAWYRHWFQKLYKRFKTFFGSAYHVEQDPDVEVSMFPLQPTQQQERESSGVRSNIPS